MKRTSIALFGIPNTESCGRVSSRTCYWGQPKTFDYSLLLGSDINNTKPSSHTPLHHVVLRLQRNASEANNARLVDCLKVLLKHGAGKAIENGDGETASQFAAARGYPEVLTLIH